MPAWVGQGLFAITEGLFVLAIIVGAIRFTRWLRGLVSRDAGPTN